MKTRAALVFNHNRDLCTDAFYPYRNRGWRAQRAGFAKICTGEKSVVPDRFPRADDAAIRAQATMFK